MEHSQATEKPVYKIYKEGAIIVGTFLGGPLAAGYMIAENFKAFQEPQKVRKTWVYAIFATVISLIAIYLIPDDGNIPDYTVPLMYTAMAYSLVGYFQKNAIAEHTQAGGAVFSWFKIICIGLLYFFITLAAGTLVLFLLDSYGFLSADGHSA